MQPNHTYTSCHACYTRDMIINNFNCQLTCDCAVGKPCAIQGEIVVIALFVNGNLSAKQIGR